MANAPTQPGQQQKRRRNRSRYAGQLQEKQELKKIFGIREGQLKKYFNTARRFKGETGPRIITILESRLDNAVFRAGFAQTRAQSRQMVSHRFFTVNGRPVDVPSYQVRKGDVVSVRESKRNASYFANFDKRMQNVRTPSWITLDEKTFGFKIDGAPTQDEANLGIDVRAIVEYFAR